MEPAVQIVLDPIVGLDTVAFILMAACFTALVSGVQLFLLRAIEKML